MWMKRSNEEGTILSLIQEKEENPPLFQLSLTSSGKIKAQLHDSNMEKSDKSSRDKASVEVKG